MKVKTSITLSDDLLAVIDKLAGDTTSRSSIIERILRDHLAQSARERRHVRELAALNRQADRLNAEAVDVLEYQSGTDDI